MVGYRLPERLETGALYAWLKSLDAAVVKGEGVHAPLEAPPAVLYAALSHGAGGLREVVLARLAVAAVSAGISRLDVHLEHPTLIEALLETLDSHPSQIISLKLTFGPRAAIGSFLCQALKGMPHLTTLTLTPVATDIHLASLANAAPPLETLDFSYCEGVTDDGVRALLGLTEDTRTMKELIARGTKLEDRAGDVKYPNSSLHTVNLWGTKVTTRACVTILSTCPKIFALTCRWTEEAVDLMVRSKRETPLTLSQLLLEDSALPPLESVSLLCPCLMSLVVRRPLNSLNVSDVLNSLCSVTSLTLLQFQPDPGILLPSTSTQVTQNLTCLHLSVLEPREVNLSSLAQTFPSLSLLELEGIIPILPRPVPDVPKSNLETLRLITALTQNYVIEASVVVWALVWAHDANTIDLGSCRDLLDLHISEALTRGALVKVENLRISGAGQVTDVGIKELMDSCPNLRRLALKMLPKERLADIERLKVMIREENMDLELITYGWKF